jgi:hypothetical protein
MCRGNSITGKTLVRTLWILRRLGWRRRVWMMRARRLQCKPGLRKEIQSTMLVIRSSQEVMRFVVIVKNMVRCWLGRDEVCHCGRMRSHKLEHTTHAAVYQHIFPRTSHGLRATPDRDITNLCSSCNVMSINPLHTRSLHKLDRSAAKHHY